MLDVTIQLDAPWRRELPWVPIHKPYAFETYEGTKTLAELFDGRSQLIVYHFMFGLDWNTGWRERPLA